jgi:hypothetical protein
MLRYFNLRVATVIKTDVSDFVIRAIFSLVEKYYVKYIAFYSRKINNCEINYQIYKNEIIATIPIFKK